MNTIRRTGSAALVAAALLASLAGCGNGNLRTTHVPIPTGSASPSTGPIALPSATPTSTTQVADPFYGQTLEPFTGDAATQFGADNVMAAYKEFVKFELGQGFSESLVPKTNDSVRDIDFSFAQDFMTPAAYASWEKAVATRNTSTDADGTVTALVLYGANDATTTFKTPLVASSTYGHATTAIDTTSDGTKRLALTFSTSAKLRATSAGKNVVFPFTRTVTLWLVPNGTPERPWLIDAWTGQVKADSAPVPDKA